MSTKSGIRAWWIMLTLDERPRGRVLLATSDIPSEYHAERLRWWTTNSLSWSAYIDGDRNRGAMLAILAQVALRIVRQDDGPLSIADLGCGEGAFLRELRKLVPEARLKGVDFCPAMLAEAKTRSAGLPIEYTLCDLEWKASAVQPRVDLVTSVLA